MNPEAPPGSADDHENAYSDLLGDDSHEGHWAFGTGFDDPLAGVDTTVPDEVDADELGRICLALADDALVHAQRLSEWIAHGPEVEEEIALANIGLDLIGQARLLYTRAATARPSLLEGLPQTPVAPEDALAYFRGPDAFTNVCLTELPRGDFAFTMVRLQVLSDWRWRELSVLADHPDPVLSAICARGTRELAYHHTHAVRWVNILGEGTPTSAERLARAHDDVEPWLAELDSEHGAGRHGRHTEHLGPLLRTMQEIARAHPDGAW